MPKAEFVDASQDVEEIARELIRAHHTHLIEAKIKFLFRFGKWQSKGKTVLGKTTRVSARDKHLHGFDFVVVLNGSEWLELTPEQKRALVDHELCHADVSGYADDGSPRWSIRDHDVEEFQAIVERHGLWQPELEKFSESAASKVRQLDIFAAAG